MGAGLLVLGLLVLGLLVLVRVYVKGDGFGQLR